MTRRSVPVFGSPTVLLLKILEPLKAKGVHVYEAFEDHMELPAVVALVSRRNGAGGFGTASPTYTRVALVELNTITDGVEADDTADKLQEAARKLLFEAWLNQDEYPGVGVINRLDTQVIASRVSDWQTSTGVVQYAELPAGAQRYEAVYSLLLRPPRTVPPVNPYI